METHTHTKIAIKAFEGENLSTNTQNCQISLVFETFQRHRKAKT